jgi:conjugative relaxase-like TrwC/TraI family protein
MLSVRRVSSGQAESYYSAEDYYLEEEQGEWQGELAEKLGFEGGIEKSDFTSLVHGIDPKGRFELGRGGADFKHSAGVDLTFSAPKSVSVAGLVMGDKKVIDAHRDAVKSTLKYIEENYTAVRHKVDGEVRTEHTGNMAAGVFHHIASRELDPQVHSHCVVMNFTETERNGESKILAMDYKNIFDNRNFLGQVYRSEMAANLKEAGYEVEWDSKGLFEIKGIDKDLLDEFSQRIAMIDARFEELKKENPSLPESEHYKLRDRAVLETRKVKDEPTREELDKQWAERAKECGYGKEEFNKLSSDIKNKEISAEKKETLNDLVSKSMAFATEFEAAPTREDIIEKALKLSKGEVRVREFVAALDKHEDVVKVGENRFSTTEIVKNEKHIVDTVINGHGKATIYMDQAKAEKEIANHELKTKMLNPKAHDLTDSQRDGVKHILSSKDSFIAIQGDAGTGKTTMLDALNKINDGKYEIVGLAPTGKAASEIESASKIESSTIASFLLSDKDLKGKLVVIDEASMITIKDMKALVDRCDENTKMVLIGDTKQLQAVGQGKIFSSLQELDAISTVRMSDTIRQIASPEYKDAVDTLGNKKVQEAFEKLDKMNSIVEIKDRSERLENIRDAYLSNPNKTIIVTAVNADRSELNTMIRKEMVERGDVGKTNISCSARVASKMQGIEKLEASNFRVNQIIISNQNTEFGKAGTEFKVLGIDKENNKLIVEDNNNKKFEAAPERLGGKELQVYNLEHKPLAQGDKIIFTKNDKSLNFKNGQVAVIRDVDMKTGNISVELDTGKHVTFNPNSQYSYVDHGYALTDYKSQGQSESRVIYHADSNKNITYNQAYVGITRGKHTVTIMTDDKTKLKEGMGIEQVKSTTLDVNSDKLTKGSINEKSVDPNTLKQGNERATDISPEKIRSSDRER